MTHPPKLVYIEYKGDGIAGPARIGWVTFSKSGRSVDYQGRRFRSLKGRGFKSNFADVETGEQFWISGCHADGKDALYSTIVEIDEDAREKYWTEIRKKPELKEIKSFRCTGKYTK